jgi:proteasome assembly chaperone (PAC2) family protein
MKNIYLSDFDEFIYTISSKIKMENNEHHKNRGEHRVLRMVGSSCSTTKTGHHDIAEILLKVALNTISQIKSLARNVHWMVLYQICVFGADLKSNMAARVHNVFLWPGELKTS